MSWSGFHWICRKKRNGIPTSPPSGRYPARANEESAPHTQIRAQIGSGSCYGLFVVLTASCFVSSNPALADDAAAPDKGFCAHCDLLVGAGETTNYRHWTGGLVLPVTLEVDDSRWEIGAFRLARRQLLDEDPKYPVSTIAAEPYWGFSLMHRWEILHRSRMRLYLGFGANYRTETDMLTATKWNFAGMIGVRFDLGEHALLEVALRHWSNAWIRFPDRGQNFVTVSVGF